MIEIINQAADHQRIFILCENVQDAAVLIKSGLSIKSVNPGNLGVPSPISLEQTLRATAKRRFSCREPGSPGYCGDRVARNVK
ncbi:TPA: PTS sugar transporter subunit IIB [Enterobacter soli]|nr:PTS sugar transporter subunit IIB [Enterobacter soli]